MKRFYREAAVAQCKGGFQVTLDGRTVKTQGRSEQIVPTRQMAELLCAEWAAQGDKVDAKSFVYRDLADFALDLIAPDKAAMVTSMMRFGESDTLCYRADPEDALFARQQELWEPLMAACETRLGVTFERISGIIYRPQSEATLSTIKARLLDQDAFSLSALNTLASLSTSLIIALAMLEESADTKALFDAANAEEDWQVELWGTDFEAVKVRKIRAEAFDHAAKFLAAVKP